MQVIKIHHPYKYVEIIDEPIALALGFFDGVHIGHQEVINTAVQEAKLRGIRSAVMTFNQHPKVVYSKMDPSEMKYLSPLERKIDLFAELDVEIVYVIEYTYDFGSLSPQKFVDDYVVGLNAEVVIAGFDYTYGKPNLANMQTLPQHAQGRFEIIEIPEMTIEEQKVGSTSIKEMIEAGDIAKANSELGYPYETSGVVVHGDKRGRTLGYPTANIQTEALEILPAVGVYVVEIKVRDSWFQGMASVGYNITFEANRQLSCEVYILNFSQTIYGEKVRVRWHSYLRPELKFNSVDELIQQLDEDLLRTKSFFAEKGE